MTGFVEPASFYEYEGQLLRYHSGGDDYTRVSVEDGPLSYERFPEALEFSTDPTDPWVRLAEAVAAGLYGNQNDGWSALVDPDEIEDIVVTETLYPLPRV